MGEPAVEIEKPQRCLPLERRSLFPVPRPCSLLHARCTERSAPAVLSVPGATLTSHGHSRQHIGYQL